MRKILSLLVAVVMAFGISVPALAADEYGGLFYNDTANNMISPRSISLGTTGTDTITVAQDEIVITDTKTGQVILPESRLEPGTDYTFKLARVTAGSGTNVSRASVTATPITKGELNGAKLRLKAAKGTSAISSAKIEEKGSGASATYNLAITTRDTYGTKVTDVEYTLSYTGGAPTVTLADGSAIFKVGYGKFTDEEIDTYSEGDIITIDPDDKTIITKKQFETLAKAYNYKNVQFEAEDGGWTYLGKISGMGDTNFYYTYDVIPSIVNKFPDQDFKFLTFPAGVNFPTNGEMRIDTSDVSGDFNKIFTYLYRNGKLTRINTTYDSGADQIVFRTNYLGAFVMTNEEITDTTIIAPEETETPTTPTTPTAPTAPTTPENPNTGTNSAAGLVAAIGLAAASSAAMIRRKK